MRILLDTHVALWAVTLDERLGAAAEKVICDPDNDVSVSAASVWEIAIKHALGRGDMPVSAASALGHFRDAGFRLLDVTAEHAAAVEALPRHHADPFDRILAAQASVERMSLLTRDPLLLQYPRTIPA
jgi:PIN domain nuclease of toxin-antitoxin system